MNVNEKQGTLRLMDRFQSSFSLRIIQGRSLIAKLDEGQFVASIGRPSY